MIHSINSTMLTVTVLVLCAGWAFADYADIELEHAEDLFEKFILDHNKNYDTYYEKQMRLEIFKKNLQEINYHNAKHNNNFMGINLFSDLTKEEFQIKHINCAGPMGVSNCTRFNVNKRYLKYKAPENFDWREQGVVTPIKNQGGCGSCWAFSVIANIESQYAKKHGNQQLDLSEQQEVDCDTYNGGCGGGSMDRAILNLVEVGGLMSEEDYPYTAVQGQCNFKADKIQAKVTGCLDFTGTPEEDIKDILVNYGPLTIALGANSMQFYQEGVYKVCDRKINHALLVVGYGTDKETQEPYWIVKNSWGETFGENGYIRLLRGNPKCEFGQHVLVTSQVA